MATGNWGCGSRLKGDPQLKLVIQWLAASLAGVPRIIYYTLGNQNLSKVINIQSIFMKKIIIESRIMLIGDVSVRYGEQSSDGQTLVCW